MFFTALFLHFSETEAGLLFVQKTSSFPIVLSDLAYLYRLPEATGQELYPYMIIYHENISRYNQLYLKEKKQYNLISILRFAAIILVICFIVKAIQAFHPLWLAGIVSGIAAFLWLLIYHGKVSHRMRFYKALVAINEEEQDYLEGKSMPWPDGNIFRNPGHPYTNDLDIFGQHSLYHHINRTTTYIGSSTLAEYLASGKTATDIRENQQAVAELANMPEWRQTIMALGRLSGDNQKSYQSLLNWARSENPPQTTLLTVLSYLMPALLVCSSLLYWVGGIGICFSISNTLYIGNLVLLSSQWKRIAAELNQNDRIAEIVTNYSLIIASIESTNFSSTKLKNMQAQLREQEVPASKHIKRMSYLFNQLNSIQNILSITIINGISLYHLHILRTLVNWKREHAPKLELWLNVIGELEALSSMANLRYNNPDFCFPELNDKGLIHFEDLGHPLISKTKRVCNSVSFEKQRFIILTGSNMSGKSTFLRTLGVNMLLAGAGSAVCASSATLQPMPVWVSMRLSDSLADSESYFFAEVKRLREIVEALEKEACFVLLDEILRGTNSDDKRSGTIGVIEKIVRTKAVGAIATHDIEVCDTTARYPDTLINKCFEVQIINNELFFDYRLLNGVCKNKSATFLMKKMGVIDQ